MLVPTVSFASGRYRIQRLVGEGGRKRVYLARDTRLERDVAVALVKMEGMDDPTATRVRREAHALGRLGDHPNVVAIYDVDDDGGQTYIVTQYMSGGSVDELLRRSEGQRLPVAEALRIAQQVCLALGFAHGCGIVHRDVKPGNIWLSGDGTAKLGDFGLAVSLDRSRLTTEGTMLGTVAYMAPEQALGRTAEPRSDLYALGATLYEMVTGRPPFVGDGPVAILSQHLHTLPVAPRWHNAAVPRELETLIMRLLAKVPEDRPANAEAVRQLLVEAAVAAPASAATSEPETRNPLDSLASGVFVGREEAMRELRAAVDRARDRQPSVVLLAGEPGIGKTRTAEEVVTYARLRGAQVLWGRCFEGEGAPAFWPWVQVIRAYAHDREPQGLLSEMGSGATDIAQLVSEVRDRLPGLPAATTLEPEQARFRLFDSIVTFLRNASKRQPTVVILDDLQWADRPSLLLLQFLAREIGEAALLIVGTYRDVEVGRQHPLGETLAALSGGPATKRIALSGLSAAEVGRFIELTAGATVPDALVAAVYRETEGNPFFTQEVVRLLVSERRLERPETVSSWSVTIPQGVREVIGRRLERLSAESNQVLAIAAAIGREFGQELLERVSGVDTDHLLDLLDQAIAERIVVDVAKPAAHYRFTHALVQETLYAEVTTARRVRLHRRIGEALEAIHPAALDRRVASLAHHFCEAAPGGDVRKAVDYAKRAGDHAQSLLAYEEGARLYEKGLQALEMLEAGDDRLRCELMISLGEAQWRAGELEKSWETCTHAAAVARSIGAKDHFVRAALGAGREFSTQEPTPRPLAIPLLEEAAEKLQGEESAVRAQVLSRLAIARHALGGDTVRMEAEAQRAVEMARRTGKAPAIVEALLAWQIVNHGPEKLSDRLAAMQEAISLAQATGQREHLGQCLFWQLDNQLSGDDGEAVKATLEAHIEIARELREPFYLWASAWQKACCAIMVGSADAADVLVHEAFSIGQRVRPAIAMRIYATQIVRVRYEQGRLAELEGFFQGIVAQQSPAWRVGLALLYTALERESEARSIFEEFAKNDFVDLPNEFGWLIAAVFLAETCAFLRDRVRAAVLYELLLPYAGQCAVIPAASVFYGPVSRFLGRLAVTMGRLDDAVAHFEHAIVLNRKLLAPPAIAHTEVWYADALVTRGHPGDREKAASLLTSALETARAFGMKPVLEAGVAVKLRMQAKMGREIATSATPGELHSPGRASHSLISHKYELLTELGRGGMGQVFKARHTGLDTILAVKVLADRLATDFDFVARFQREARTMARLSHPNIVRVLDVGTDGATHYFVMEYVEGATLAELLREGGALPLAKVIEIALQIGAALEHAHRCVPPVVHRDVSPANVLIEEGTGRVVVTDFGIAKVAAGKEAALTRTGDFLGKARYAAPEQLRGERDVDGRADIYSLGLLMHEMFSGYHFFAGLDDDAIVRRVLSEPDVRAIDFTRATPAAFGAMVVRAIAKDRGQRYQTIGDLLAELGRLRDSFQAPSAADVVPMGLSSGDNATVVGGRAKMQ